MIRVAAEAVVVTAGVMVAGIAAVAGGGAKAVVEAAAAEAAARRGMRRGILQAVRLRDVVRRRIRLPGGRPPEGPHPGAEVHSPGIRAGSLRAGQAGVVRHGKIKIRTSPGKCPGDFL